MEHVKIFNGIVPDHEKPGSRCVVVRRVINLGYWEFGMGREWGGG